VETFWGWLKSSTSPLKNGHSHEQARSQLAKTILSRFSRRDVLNVTSIFLERLKQFHYDLKNVPLLKKQPRGLPFYSAHFSISFDNHVLGAAMAPQPGCLGERFWRAHEAFRRRKLRHSRPNMAKSSFSDVINCFITQSWETRRLPPGQGHKISTFMMKNQSN
jgi:hypothetical protein